MNSTGDPGLLITSGDRLGFDQSGTRSWTVKAANGNLDFNSGDGLGYNKFNMGVIVIGNVGIGTAGPHFPLEVVGNFEVSDGGGATRKALDFWSSGTYSGIDSYQYGTGPLPLVINQNGGNVGIGTTDPGYKLDIAGTLHNNGNVMLGPVTAGYPYQSALTWQSDNTGYYMGIGYQKTDASNKKLHLWWIDNVLETNVNSVLNIATPGHTFDGTAPNSGRTIGASIAASGDSYFTGGNVGIGTTSPVSNLNVLASAVTNSASLANLKNNSSFWVQTFHAGTAGVNFGEIYPNVQVIQSMYSSDASVAPLTINPYGGNVGIGTTNPAVPLDVRYPYAKTDTTRRGIQTLYSNDTSNATGLVITSIGAATQANRVVSLQTQEQSEVVGID